MPRKPRVEVENGIAHVYARGNNRRSIFVDEDDRLRYLRILASVVEAQEWRCLGYCLMTNHVHLIVETPQANLGAGMAQLHGPYARSFNRRHRRRNHLFGDRYGTTPIRNPEHLWFASAYVALNPVRAGICARPEDWPWSSHAAIAGERTGPHWLEVRHFLSYWSGLGGEPRERYIGLVAAIQTNGAAGFDQRSPRG